MVCGKQEYALCQKLSSNKSSVLADKFCGLKLPGVKFYRVSFFGVIFYGANGIVITLRLI